jgi:nitrogen regulatory protein PII
MKVSLRSVLAAATVSLALSTTAAFAAADEDSGFVDIGQLLPSAKGQFVEVNLSPAMLKFAARIAKHQDEDAADIVGDIQRIRVNVVGLDDANRAANVEKIEAVRAKLEKAGWQRMVTVREQGKGDDVAIFAKMKGEDVIEGLVVTVIDHKGEAVFVNIVGSINADKIGALAEKYDIEPLRHVHIKAKAKA